MRAGRYEVGDRHVAGCARCHWGRNFDTAAEADIAHVTHTCPWRGANMPAGKSLITQAWEQLDEQVDEIVELASQEYSVADPDDPELLIVIAKARARGKAEILALFMAPHFSTADEVSAESSRRRAARLRGEEYMTPGTTS